MLRIEGFVEMSRGISKKEEEGHTASFAFDASFGPRYKSKDINPKVAVSLVLCTICATPVLFVAGQLIKEKATASVEDETRVADIYLSVRHRSQETLSHNNKTRKRERDWSALE